MYFLSLYLQSIQNLCCTMPLAAMCQPCKTGTSSYMNRVIFWNKKLTISNVGTLDLFFANVFLVILTTSDTFPTRMKIAAAMKLFCLLSSCWCLSYIISARILIAQWISSSLIQFNSGGSKSSTHNHFSWSDCSTTANHAFSLIRYKMSLPAVASSAPCPRPCCLFTLPSCLYQHLWMPPNLTQTRIQQDDGAIQAFGGGGKVVCCCCRPLSSWLTMIPRQGCGRVAILVIAPTAAVFVMSLSLDTAEPDLDKDLVG